VTGALTAWWANPVTAVLAGVLLWLLAGAGAVGLVAVVRLGAIPLGGLLSQKSELLPGFPRRVDATSAIVLMLAGGEGLLAVVVTAAFIRAGAIGGIGLAGGLAIAFFSWLLLGLLALAVVRGPRVEPAARATLSALRPATGLLTALARFEVGDEEEDDEEEDDDELDEHEMQAFIDAGEEAGIIEHEDAELITSIVELADTVVREILTPRTDVIAVSVAADFGKVQQRFAESMFTRLPAYRETLDRIEGVVHVKDVLRAAAAGERPSAGELLRPVLVVPETKPLRELLREFQAARQQLAVVVDEYGGTSGIVTLEDVLEEIVGEIQDEHQREGPEYVREAPGVYVVDGGAHFEVIEEIFDVEVGDVGFDSVAGLVLDRLGHLPRLGEKASWQGLELEVVEVDRRRLRRVRVSGPEKKQ
jgi:CBS domain containing-hemolysin-like protein